jgi:hypothetical protein
MSRILISTAAAWLIFILGSNLWGNLVSDSFIRIILMAVDFGLFSLYCAWPVSVG